MLTKLKANPVSLGMAALVAIALVVVYNLNRGSAPYSSGNVTTFLVVGIALGGIYAISALGLVVTYSTTGIFNFAHGAIGAFLAFCYWELRVNHHWPALLALIMVLFVIAPLLGVLLDILLMRRLRNAALVVQLMVTVGLMLCFMGITLTIWKPNVTGGRNLPQFFEDSPGVEIGDITATWHRIITVATALAIAIVLRTVLYKTRTGIAMRAVVDNRSLAGLNGIKPNVISSASWALGCMTAGAAGILIAPESGMVVENLTLLVITAFAAAAIAQLKSLPWAFAGGLLIGLTKAFSNQFLTFDSNWSYVREAIPAIILFIAVIFLPQARLETGRIELTKRTERLTTPKEAIGGALVMVGIVTAWANGWIPWFTGTNFGERSEVWLGRGAGFLVIAMIMLSLVPLIGWAGQVSFANFAIAGFGAVMFAKVGGQDGNPIGLLIVVLICAPLGVLIALPALRLKGLYLALATMAFAEFADKVLFRHPDILTNQGGRLYEPLDILGIKMSSDPGERRAFVILLAIIFGVMFVGLSLLRNSRWARRWIAIADSPAASATIGLNLTAAKIAVFALSGAIAGLAGAFLGLQRSSLSVDSFPLFAGLPLVLLLAVQGVRFPAAAFMGAIGLASFPALQEMLGKPGWLTSVELIGPGIAAIVMAFRPHGAVFYSGKDLAPKLPWRHDAREEQAFERQRLRDQDIGRDEIGDLGLTRGFSAEKIAQLERRLGVVDELAAPGTADSASNGTANGTSDGAAEATKGATNGIAVR